jgi:hypothetical protein
LDHEHEADFIFASSSFYPDLLTFSTMLRCWIGVPMNGPEAEPPKSEGRWGKPVAGFFSVVMLGATIAPIVENWRETPQDSFPFSHYPMFSQRRGETYVVHYLMGVDADGNRQRISHRLAGSGGFNQTRRQINRMIREEKAGDLAKTIAAKIARGKRTDYDNIVTVQVVTGTFRFAAYFAGDMTPEKERVRASAQVKRSEP